MADLTLVVNGHIQTINRFVHVKKLASIFRGLGLGVRIVVDRVDDKYKDMLYKLDPYTLVHSIPSTKVWKDISYARYVSKHVRSEHNLMLGVNWAVARSLKKFMLFGGGFGIVPGVRAHWSRFNIEATLNKSARIIVETPSVTQFYPFLEKYRHKIFDKGALYVEPQFGLMKPFGQRERNVVYVGSMIAGKGVPALIDAGRTLTAQEPETSLTFVGAGPLVEKVRSLGNPRLTAIGESVEVWRYLNDARLLVLPSLSEGLPNSVLEAIACGTPPLAYPVGGLRDVLRNGQNGFFLSPSEDLAEQIHRCLEMDLARTSDACLQTAKEFTLEGAIQRYRSLFS